MIHVVVVVIAISVHVEFTNVSNGMGLGLIACIGLGENFHFRGVVSAVAPLMTVELVASVHVANE